MRHDDRTDGPRPLPLWLRVLGSPFLLVRHALVGTSELVGPPLGRYVTRRPAMSLALALGGALGGAIVFNAVALQNERHPAPLFKLVFPEKTAEVALATPVPARPRATETPPSARSAPATPAPAQSALPRDMLVRELQTELASRGYYAGPKDGKENPGLARAIRDFERAAGVPETGVVSEEVLTKLSATGVTLRREMDDLVRAAADAPDAGRVKSVQRALNRAGYGPVKEDGVMGATTRAAIEAFERDRKLTVTGKPQGKVLKLLASASGVPIE